MQPPGPPYGSYPGQYPNQPGYQPYPPPAPPPLIAPPPAKKHTGRNMAIILGVLALLLCCGTPAAFGVRYVTMANGPYFLPPNLCLTMNSATAIRLKAGEPPNPEMDQASEKEPYVGCRWYKQGVFSFMVHVQIYHRSPRRDSVGQSRELYRFSRGTVESVVAVRDVGIGDQAFLTLDDRFGTKRFAATVRIANAHIIIDYGGGYTDRTQPLSAADRDAELDNFQSIVRDLVADVIEDLH